MKRSADYQAGLCQFTFLPRQRGFPRSIRNGTNAVTQEIHRSFSSDLVT